MPDGGKIAELLIVCLLAGILGQVLSGILRLPSIVFLLAFGVALGPDVGDLIDPRALGPGLEVLVRVSVAFILFEGSMALRLREIRKVQLSVRRLITVGLLFTFVAASAAAHFLAELPLRYAALFGALVTVTGPTVIRPLVQRIRMRPELAAILEGEGILADPLGAILAAVCLEYALAPGSTFLQQAQEFGIRIGIGIGVGAVIGALAGLIVKYRAPAVERIKPLVVLACALGCYAVAESLRHEAGIMAVVAAGLAIQHGLARHDRELREFKELLTTLLISVLFVLLAANLRKDRMLAEGLPGLLTVGAVMLLVRPLNIFLSTRGGAVNLREKLFLSWVAPRGIVAASVASLGAMVLEREGHADAHRVESLVFLTILLTVFFQGGTATPLASILGITVKGARTVIVVGANAVGCAVARAYRDAGKKVTLVDRNPALADAALADGLRALAADATDRDVLHFAGLDEADVLLCLTPSTTVNQTAARVALHDKPIEKVWVVLDENDRHTLDALLVRQGAEIAFAGALPFGIWVHQLENGRARMVEVPVTEKNAPKKPFGQVTLTKDAVPLLLRRNSHLEIVSPGTRPQAGDRVTFLTRAPDDAVLRDTLGVVPNP